MRTVTSKPRPTKAERSGCWSGWAVRFPDGSYMRDVDRMPTVWSTKRDALWIVQRYADTKILRISLWAETWLLASRERRVG